MIATVLDEFDCAPVTLKLPGASVLGGVPVVLLVKVLRVAPLLLLLLHLHPAGGHRRREARGQRLKAGQLHQGHQAFCGERLVYEEVHSWTKPRQEHQSTLGMESTVISKQKRNLCGFYLRSRGWRGWRRAWPPPGAAPPP